MPLFAKIGHGLASQLIFLAATKAGPIPEWTLHLFQLAGGLTLVGAAWTYIVTRKLVRRGIRTEGFVIRFASGGKGTRRAVFRFRDQTGITRECTTWLGSSLPLHKVGQVVKVLYLPEAPEKGRLDSFFEIWFFPYFLLFFGAMFLFIPVLIPSHSPNTTSQPPTPASQPAPR